MFTTIIMAIITTAIGITIVTAQATTGIRRHDIRSAHTINAQLELAIIRAPTRVRISLRRLADVRATGRERFAHKPRSAAILLAMRGQGLIFEIAPRLFAPRPWHEPLATIKMVAATV
ncbi:MAG: hypothetical protein IIA11_08840 [Proteobacteria bacterium]|nr:hypothetical protein [Pseudomonadota bacterium]